MARPRLDWRFILVATLILPCRVTLSRVGRPGAPPFCILHDRQTVTWITWLVLAPAIIAAARRFPFGDGAPMRWLWRHLALGAAFSALAAALVAGIGALMR